MGSDEPAGDESAVLCGAKEGASGRPCSRETGRSLVPMSSCVHLKLIMGAETVSEWTGVDMRSFRASSLRMIVPGRNMNSRAVHVLSGE